MGTRRKLLSIIEAAYEPADDFDTWARHSCDALTGLFPGPVRAFVLVHRPRGGHVRVEAVHALEGGEGLLSVILEMSRQATPDDVKKLWGESAGVGTMSEQLGIRRQDALPEWMAASESVHRSKDALGLFFERRDGRMITFNLALHRRRTLEPRERLGLTRVLSHLALAERLLLSDKPKVAIVDAARKVVHAEGVAKAIGARAALRAQALRMDKARSRALGDEDAVELWRGMVEGQWSLVDEFDTDGKRLFVARENVGLLAGSRALTKRERQVLALVLTGRSNKLVAYELGLAPSTVSLSLRSILAKTGAPHRDALVEFADVLGKKAPASARAQGGATRGRAS